MVKITKIEASHICIPKKIRVAAYARVSTDSSDQLLSLETQKEHYESYIKSNSAWEYAGLYFDEGISGTKTTKRDELLRLINDCENGKIDRVITKSISRFARNTTDCLEMVRKLLRLGVSIYFEKENIDTACMNSELMLSILSSIAEGESKSISLNSKWGVKCRFEDTTFIISTPPYGYKNTDGKMTVVPEEANVVKEIFSMSVNGLGCGLIARELNKKGLRTRKGKPWGISSIENILKNEKYTGDAIFQKTFTDESFNRHENRGEENMYLVKNHHEAIITHEQFEMASQAMDRRRGEKGIAIDDDTYQNRYIFSRKIKCGECGEVFKRRIHHNPDYIAWTCKGHLKDKEHCNMKFVREEELKEAFIRMMWKLRAGKDEVLKPLINSLRGYDNKESLNKILELENKIVQNSKQQKVLADLFATEYLEPEVYQREKRQLEAEALSFEKEKKNISDEVNGDLKHLDNAQKLLKIVSKCNLPKNFDEALFEEAVESITVLSRGKVSFNLKCGLTLNERLVKA